MTVGATHPGERFQVGAVAARLTDGQLRDVTIHDRVVAARIYPAVRDTSWNTVPYRVDATRVVTGPDGLDITVVGTTSLAGLDDLSWEIRVELRPDSLAYDLRLAAHAGVDVNRAGICVLLPTTTYRGGGYQLAGAGGENEGVFEELVEPQVITADGVIHAMTATFATAELRLPVGGAVRLDCRGAEFEIEDQRNWTDESWKAYAPSITAGFPYHLAAGTVVHQGVTLTATELLRPDGEELVDPGSVLPQTVLPQAVPAQPVSTHAVGARASVARVAEASGCRLSTLGLLVDADVVASDPELQAAVRDLRLDHVRLDVDGSQTDAAQRVSAALDLADALVCAVELAVEIQAGGDEGLTEIARLVRQRPSVIRRLLLLSADSTIRAKAADRWGDGEDGGPDLPVFLGAPGFFAEWNRDRPEAGSAYGVVFGSSPQIHLGDDEAVLSTPPTYADLAATIRAHCPESAIAASPVTLRTLAGPCPREAFADPLDRNGDGRRWDDRLGTMFGAAWALGVIAEASFAGIGSVTLQAAAGPHGVFGRDSADTAGAVRRSPVAALLAELAGWAGCDVRRIELPSPDLVGLVVRSGAEPPTLYLANVGPATVQLRLDVDPRTVDELRADDSGHVSFQPGVPHPIEQQEGWVHLGGESVTRVTTA